MPQEHLDDQIPDTIWDVDLDEEELDEEQQEEDQEDPNLDNPDNEEEEEEQEDAEDDDPESEEEEDDDQEDQEEDDEEEDTPPEWYVKEEDYKQLQSAASKGTQKLIGRNKALYKAFDVLWDIAEDQSKLIEVYESEPEVAQVILEKYYEGKTIQEFAKDVLDQDYEPTTQKEALSEEEIRQQVRDEIQSEEVQSYVGQLFEKAKLSKADAKKVLEEFNDLAEGKKLTKEKARKYFQIAYSIARKVPNKDNKTKIAKKTSSWKGWGGWWGKSKGKGWDPFVQDSIDFLKEHWLT